MKHTLSLLIALLSTPLLALDWSGGESVALEDGTQGVRWIPKQSAALKRSFSPPADWSAYGMLRFRLHSAKATQASFMLLLASDNPKSEGADYYSYRITQDWEGWRTFELPFAELGITREPLGWQSIQSATFTAAGWNNTPHPDAVLMLGNWELTAGQPCGPSMDDAAFFKAIDLDLPALAKVKNAVDAHDFTRARAAFADHIRNRSWPTWRIDWRARPTRSGKAPKPNDKAEKLLKKEFSFSFSERQWPIAFGNQIDWHANPTEGVNRTHLWNESLNRHFHVRDLANAYWETGDDRYAAGIAEHVMDWIKRNPRPLLSSGNGSSMTNCTWQTLTTGIRMEGIWPDALYRCMGSPAFTDDVIVTMVKSCADQAEHLVAHPSHGNWLTEESMGVYTVGMLFPEYRKAKEWRRIAIERLNRQLDEEIYPDGMQVELAAGYSNWVIQNLTQLLERAEAAGLRDEIPSDFLARLERAYNYHLYASTPDGKIPGLNDSGSADIRPPLATASKLFPKRTDFLYVSTSGRQGKEPEGRSYPFPYTGHYVMRSGWSNDALYALLDSGPFGLGHQHEDKLSFVVYAYGRQLLLDPGNFSYDRSPERMYVLGTHGHNTIMVDQQGQERKGNRKTYVWPKPWDTPAPRGDDTAWLSTSDLDCVRGRYTDGYGPKAAIRVSHTRAMAYVKPDYFVILDTLSPGDDREHTYTSLYHIDDTDALLDAGSLSVTTRTAGKANIALVPAKQAGLECRIIKGQREPVQGWSNHPWREVPTALYTWKGKGQTQQALVLYPLKPGESCPVQQVVLRRQEGGTDIEISLKTGRTDRIRFADKDGQPAAQRLREAN